MTPLNKTLEKVIKEPPEIEVILLKFSSPAVLQNVFTSQLTLNTVRTPAFGGIVSIEKYDLSPSSNV